MSGETEQQVSGWTVDTVKELMATLIHESDRRYEQRFEAQENATALALNRVDKEFHEHLQQVREETRAALNAADKAITKQERETEQRISKQEGDIRDRFATVNEFRGQLSDLISTFMPRAEADARIRAVVEKLDGAIERETTATKALESRHNDLELRLSNKLATGEGHGAGQDKFREYIGWIVAIAAGLWAIITKT